MAHDSDQYEAYYGEKLWSLLPEVYRADDADAAGGVGPLRELVLRIGAQAAILRRGIDRLWEDQSIETCDDWVVPYIGDLLATNLVSSHDARGQRLDVAKTIYYRRRKGTVAVLEEIANDITSWDAHVVEFFRRLSRTRHGFDPEIGLPADTPDPAGNLMLQQAERLTGLLHRRVARRLRQSAQRVRREPHRDELRRVLPYRRRAPRRGRDRLVRDSEARCLPLAAEELRRSARDAGCVSRPPASSRSTRRDGWRRCSRAPRGPRRATATHGFRPTSGSCRVRCPRRCSTSTRRSSTPTRWRCSGCRGASRTRSIRRRSSSIRSSAPFA